MTEQNLNFDRRVERTGTDSLKYDWAERFGLPEGLHSYWVADMDFPTSSFIQEAIDKVVSQGAFGYTEPKEDYFEALKTWMETRHHFSVDRHWLVKTPGVVFALAHAVRAFTDPYDAVLIQEPVYYPFRNVIESNGRTVISNNLVLREDGTYGLDLADFEHKIRKYHIKLFLLCSPHNPVGRVWTKEELKAMGDICKRFGTILVSDEIHADLTFGKPHTVFSTVDPDFAEFSVICTAPSKTFNLAGLQVSNIFIPNRALRQKFKKTLERSGAGQLNQLGLAACKAAYQSGSTWYEAMLSYVNANLDFAVDFINTRIPGLHANKPEGTYLLWVDCRGLGLSGKELDRFIQQKAGLWLDGGTMFGAPGEGFQRINVATSRAYLQEGLELLEAAVKKK